MCTSTLNTDSSCHVTNTRDTALAWWATRLENRLCHFQRNQLKMVYPTRTWKTHPTQPTKNSGSQKNIALVTVVNCLNKTWLMSKSSVGSFQPKPIDHNLQLQITTQLKAWLEVNTISKETQFNSNHYIQGYDPNTSFMLNLQVFKHPVLLLSFLCHTCRSIFEIRWTRKLHF